MSRVFLPLCVLSVIGAAAVFLGTSRGPGLSPDSAVYIGVARSLLEGRGLTVPFGTFEPTPLTHYPPLFPALLALIAVFSGDQLIAARWLNIFLFGANVLLVGVIVNRYTCSVRMSLLGAILALNSIVMLWIHSWVWTEPLFVFLGLLGLLQLAEHLENPSASLLIISASTIALAFLSRYAGVALVGAGITGILLLSEKGIYARIRDSALFLAISSFPMVIWVIRNMSLAGASTDRDFAFHPVTISHARYALHMISSWALPIGSSALVGAIVLLPGAVGLLLAAAVNKFLRKDSTNSSNPAYNNGEKRGRLFPLLGLFIFIYAILLIVTMSFFDADTTPDNRILSPIYLPALICCLCAGYKVSRDLGRIRGIRLVCVAVCTILAVCCIFRSMVSINYNRTYGLGYMTGRWRSSETMDRIKAIPPEFTVFTNVAPAVYLLTGRSAVQVPMKVNIYTLRANTSYSSEFAAMGERLRKGDAILAYFSPISPNFPSEMEIRSQFSLRVIARMADGVFYGVAQPHQRTRSMPERSL
jgi:4-amino-4-deoxy-L-arabinose transferase-like glycosyltransferase